MATAVPYRPELTVSDESSRPQSYVRVDAPLAAFGGNVADAVKGLGNTFSNVGSELYDRAVAMQTVNEQAKATAATADFMTQLGEKWAQYKTLQGDAAVAEQPKFVAELNALRAKQREALTSPYAQRAFDNETRLQQARTVMSSADHAATQNRQFLQSASAARVNASVLASQANPKSRETYEAGLASNQREIEASSTGQPPEAKALALQLANSNLTLKTAQAMAEDGDEGPAKAKRFLEEAMKRGTIVGDDINKASTFIQKKLHTRQANLSARQTVTGENLAIGDREVSPTQASEAVGGVGNEARSTRMVAPGKTENNPLLGKYYVAEQNLAPWLAEAGMPAMTKEEFLANSAAQEQLFKAKFAALQKEKGTFNKAYEEWQKLNPGNTDATSANIIAANRTLARRASLSELDEAARSAVRKVDDDPELGDLTARQIALRKTRQEAQDRNETTRSNQIIAARMNEKGPGGKLISSREELLNTPERRAAYDSLPDTVQRKIDKDLEANARGGYAATPENQAKFMGLRGAMLDPNMSQDQRDELLSMNVINLEMPAAQRQTLITMQAKLMRDAIKAPNVASAMSQLKPRLDALKITDKEDVNTFRGALAGIIAERMEREKRPLKPAEIQEAGNELLRERAYNHLWGLSTTKDYNFRAPVPEAEKPNIIKKFKELNDGREPNDDEMRAVFIRMKSALDYQRLYGRPKIPDRAQ